MIKLHIPTHRQSMEAKQQASLALQLTVYAIIISVLLGAGQIFFQVFEMIIKK